MLPLTNKEKETRIVTFKEDYASKPGKAAGKIIYRKGTVHAIHFKLVKKLEATGVKMDVKKYDKEAAERRIKARLKEQLN